jgi:hypothetical protein
MTVVSTYLLECVTISLLKQHVEVERPGFRTRECVVVVQSCSTCLVFVVAETCKRSSRPHYDGDGQSAFDQYSTETQDEMTGHGIA